VQSLGNTLKRWRSEILAHHETGASNDRASYCASL
jgi:transposase